MRKVGIALVVIVVLLVVLRLLEAADQAVDEARGQDPATSTPAASAPATDAPAASAPAPSAPATDAPATSTPDDGDTGDGDTGDGDVQPPTGTAAPVGLLYNANPTGNFEIYRLNDDGSNTQLTNDPAFDSWWARPAPDGSRMLFYRTPAGTHDTNYGATSMWLANSDGSGAVEAVPQGAYGWGLHGHGEWSPDGQRLVMFGGPGINPQIFVTDAQGQNPRQLTDQGGQNLDPSWSPDGSTIVYIGCPNPICFEANQEVYVIPADGGERQRLTDDDLRDNDPYYSPDGSRVAFLTQTSGTSLQAIAGLWDIRMVAANGGEASVLTDGEAITSLPRWNADGSAIFTHRLVYGSGSGFDLVSVDPDTGNFSIVLQTDADEEYPSP